jgi:hypothetical protein
MADECAVLTKKENMKRVGMLWWWSSVVVV